MYVLSLHAAAAMPIGSYSCFKVEQNCGTDPGTPCCPSMYHISSNPSMPRPDCGASNAFCNYEGAGPGFPYWKGTCGVNAPDCGRIGKKCCISTGGGATGTKCGPYFGEPGFGTPGSKGYCADAAGKGLAGGTRLGDLICTRCPDKVDSSTKQTNPLFYYACASDEQQKRDDVQVGRIVVAPASNSRPPPVAPLKPAAGGG